MRDVGDMRSGFRKLAIAFGFLTFWMVPLAGFGANEPTPTVKITTVLPVDTTADPDKAYMCLSGTNAIIESVFGLDIKDKPTNRTECILSGPTYKWTISPANSLVKLSPTNDAKTTLSVSNVASACGEYNLHVEVKWDEQKEANWVSPPGEEPRKPPELACKDDLKITILKIDLDGKEPDGTGGFNIVDDSDEENPGVWLANTQTQLRIQDPGINTGTFTIDWLNPSPSKKIQMDNGGGPQDPPISVPCTGTWPKDFTVTTIGAWLANDTSDVDLSHSSVSCTDKVVLRPLKIEFIRAYESESGHHVNRINETKFRDETPLPDANQLYLVSESDGKGHISLDLKVQPVSLRNHVCWTLRDWWAPLATGPMPGDPDTDASILFPVDGGNNGQVFAIEYGFDANGNSQLDPSEYRPHPDPENPPMVKNFGVGYYNACKLVLAGGSVLPYDIAGPLLTIFYDGGIGGLVGDDQPTSIASENFNGLGGDYYSKWLIHNAGQTFADDGTCNIKHYTWNASFKHSDKIARSSDVQARINTIYQAHLSDIATYFAGQTVGSVHTFAPWLESGMGVDEVFEFGGVIADLKIAFARVKVDSHAIQVTAKKEATGIKILVITSIGSISDLYDFNELQYFPANRAAVVQLGFGSGRNNGEIFKDTFHWDYDWTDSGEINTIITP